MSNDETVDVPYDLDGVSSLNDEDFSQFLEEKKVRLSCGECGHPQTYLAVQRTGKIPTIVSTDFPPNFDTAILNFYYELVCMNCGHIRLFERGIVSQWKHWKQNT